MKRVRQKQRERESKRTTNVNQQKQTEQQQQKNQNKTNISAEVCVCLGLRINGRLYKKWQKRQKKVGNQFQISFSADTFGNVVFLFQAPQRTVIVHILINKNIKQTKFK